MDPKRSKGWFKKNVLEPHKGEGSAILAFSTQEAKRYKVRCKIFRWSLKCEI